MLSADVIKVDLKREFYSKIVVNVIPFILLQVHGLLCPCRRWYIDQEIL